VRRAAIWVVLLFALAFVSVAQEKGEATQEAHHAEPDMTGWKWANFAILAFALGYLAVKQGGPFFASRSVEIRKGIEDAQKLRADAEARAAEMDARLANLGVEVEAMRKAAKDEAAQEGARIRQETERELAKIQTNADQEIANALKTAQMELKSYSAQLAVDLARKKVRDRMTPADQDSLVQAFTADLGGTPK
jgi:F-type H+-transporting ATPase subunit b